METPSPSAGLGVLGAGAAACAACCTGPILGFLAATGMASIVGAVVFGVIGLLVVLAVAALVWRRRRRARKCAPPAGSTPVDAPEIRIKSPR